MTDESDASLAPEPEPIWALVANVREQTIVGEDHRSAAGTRKFAPGAKVYFHSAYWGSGGETVTVIGRHRGSRRLVKVTMDARHLHRWRVKLVYRPAIVQRLDDGEICRSADPEAQARGIETLVRSLTDGADTSPEPG